jgi:Cys-tRNA(Pro) deacylase
VLDAAGIDYTVHLHRAEVYTAEEAARQRGVSLSQVTKCMVAQDAQSRVYAFLIPGDRTLKLKKVRRLVGGIRIHLMSPRQIASDLRLVVGAISPIQLISRADFYVDHHVLRQERVTISGGRADVGIGLRSEDLRRVTGAQACDMISSAKT